MSKVVFCNNDITDVKYSGFTITKMYACGGELVYEYERPTPSNPIARVYYSNEWLEIGDDDSNSAVTSGEVNTWLTSTERSGFTTLFMYDNCKEVGNSAFSDCSSLSSITSWGVVEVIGERAFKSCYRIKSVYLPCHIREVGNYAFWECYGMTSATICNSSNDISIGKFAFATCGLSELNLGQKVTTIGNAAFYQNRLTAVTIPSSVTSIGDNAFGNNTGMTKVTMESTTPPTVTSTTFGQNDTYPIVVPDGYKHNYQIASGWSTYANRIKYIYEI